ncbi:YbaY family lipoprotein [Ruegeria arenilitoris]|uniref:YbaY family lipoprotein n=1 Tax=Ruegeria arenilitoris TaxID=1173585 RepID=UPI00147ECF42|nr:YbaY family lipoprotein [Ruegeria arenilitoris]
MPKTGRAVLASTAIWATLCGAGIAGTIQGSATYREKIAVPPDATLYVELQDVSKADAPAEILAAQRYALTGVPADFELTYDDALIKDNMRYVVRGSIYQGKKLIFTTDTAYPVLTDGAGDSADLVLVKVQPQGVAMLENTTWNAAVLQGAALNTDKRPEISFAAGGAFSGTSGCNRFNGQAEISGSSIDFPENMAATLMACPPPLDEVERQFLKALQSTTTYALKGERLAFLNAAGEPVVQFTLSQ